MFESIISFSGYQIPCTEPVICKGLLLFSMQCDFSSSQADEMFVDNAFLDIAFTLSDGRKKRMTGYRLLKITIRHSKMSFIDMEFRKDELINGAEIQKQCLGANLCSD